MGTVRSVFCVFMLAFTAGDLLSQDEFATIPAHSYTVVDGLTGIEGEVSVSGFSIAVTETTQQEFARLMGYNPSFHEGDNLPVENVSWWEAVRYCNLRSLEEGLDPCYDLSTGDCDYSVNGYRLPTSAEWHFADSCDVPHDVNTIHGLANIGSGNALSIPLLKKELSEKGTKQVRSYPPNHFGLFDMLGNVWEWCDDFLDRAADTPSTLTNPRGPEWGPERVIYGGSFFSLSSTWGRGYSSCMRPEHRSRFTGFRICKSGPQPDVQAMPAGESWFEPYNRVPEGFENRTGSLPPLVTVPGSGKINTAEQWLDRSEQLKTKWSKILGEMPQMPGGVNVKHIKTYEHEGYTGKMMYLQTEPDSWEKIFLMIPRKPLKNPAPVVIVPYYDIDTPAGENMGGRVARPYSVRSFAYMMVQRGYIACAVRWFGESYGEGYGEAVANLKLRHPGLSGLGKWVWDSQRLVDYLCTLPEIDREKIGIIGHSLGGKMAFYAAAFDPRIRVCAGSDFGMGLTFSNYDNYWYFDETIRGMEKHTDHHELLGLIAPRAFLLIGGDNADNDNSWYYINSAREVYNLFGKPENIGYFNHRSGHTPTPEAVRLALDWLIRYLGEP
ncbi:SUMF1/EgtB/PvdO family nonheme iron enzyme [Gemmatimonadota bacterium]